MIRAAVSTSSSGSTTIGSFIIRSDRVTSATIDGIRLKIGAAGDFQYLDLASSGIELMDDNITQNVITDSVLTGAESGNLALFYIDMDLLELAIALSAGEIIWVQVITAEGYEDTVEITVSA